MKVKPTYQSFPTTSQPTHLPLAAYLYSSPVSLSLFSPLLLFMFIRRCPWELTTPSVVSCWISYGGKETCYGPPIYCYKENLCAQTCRKDVSQNSCESKSGFDGYSRPWSAGIFRKSSSEYAGMNQYRLSVPNTWQMHRQNNSLMVMNAINSTTSMAEEHKETDQGHIQAMKKTITENKSWDVSSLFTCSKFFFRPRS